MTTPFTVTAHNITSGQSALSAAFRSLPDGEYVAEIRPAGSAVVIISGILDWYREQGDEQRNDPNFLTVLLRKADLLALALVDLAAETGEAYAEKLRTDTERKNTYNKAMYEAKKAATGAGGKLIIGHAEIDANYAIIPLLSAEATADAIYKQTVLFAEAARDVVFRMAQNMADLRDDKGLNIRGGVTSQK
jgi:hypothetical protein